MRITYGMSAGMKFRIEKRRLKHDNQNYDRFHIPFNDGGAGG